MDKEMINFNMKTLSVTEYSKLLGVTRQAVLWQIKYGKLAEGVSATKVGCNWIVKKEE